MKKVELLVPVGNKECLEAAIHNGADAVYLGGKRFGARAYSNNFTDEEMVEAIKKCHLYGVKIYVTVNTMIYNEEVMDCLNYLTFLYNNNVDAVIMQDVGLIALSRKLLPNLEIHVSTQAHNHNNKGISYFKNIGCTRVVFDRESSLKEIEKVKVDIEKEIFIHGALCISYSGNCLFSVLNGGRSANRGMCVGSCRLFYTLEKNKKKVKEGYLLSTKDLNTINYLKDILDSSVQSLKIEGRMKSKEYVAIITRIYRLLIDQYYNGEEMVIHKDFLKKMYQIYNRKFTKGYLFDSNNIINDLSPNHQGIRIGVVKDVTKSKIAIKLEENIHQEDAIRLQKVNKGLFLNKLYSEKGLLISKALKGETVLIDNKFHFLKEDILNSVVLRTIDFLLNEEVNSFSLKRIPISLKFSGLLNKPAKLLISDSINEIEVLGPVLEPAYKMPINEGQIIKQLDRLKNTSFLLEKIEVNIDSQIFINIKELNEMRREAVRQLISLREGIKKEEKLGTVLIKNNLKTNKSKISILTRTEEQLNIALKNNIDIIYTTNSEIYNKYKDYDNVYLRLERVIKAHPDYQKERLLCTELGSVLAYGEKNEIRSDYYFNVANDFCIEELRNLKTESVTLSVESSLEQYNKINYKDCSEVIVYGYLECMVIKNNIFNVSLEDTFLVDNKENKYLVKWENGLTHIFNSKPLNIIADIPKIPNFAYYRIELLNETQKEIQNLINMTKNMIQ